jgi:hypothetical protein
VIATLMKPSAFDAAELREAIKVGTVDLFQQQQQNVAPNVVFFFLEQTTQCDS